MTVTAAAHDLWLHIKALRDPIMRPAAIHGLSQIIQTEAMPMHIRERAAQALRDNRPSGLQVIRGGSDGGAA